MKYAHTVTSGTTVIPIGATTVADDLTLTYVRNLNEQRTKKTGFAISSDLAF